MVEGAPLLRAYGSKAHRGFESLPLRHSSHKFSSFSFRRLRQRRSGGSNPEGSTKSPKAILDDAHASPEGRGPKARVNPSLSASRHINSHGSRSDYRDSDEAGITLIRAAPGGEAPSVASPKAPEFSATARLNGDVGFSRQSAPRDVLRRLAPSALYDRVLFHGD